MPTFFFIDGIKVDLYYNDHAPPHFHAKYAEYENLIAIKTLTKLKGDLPPKQHKKIIKWSKKNQDVLMEIWDTLSS